jgi:Carboxypeptidase regulatory-like domain
MLVLDRRLRDVNECRKPNLSLRPARGGLVRGFRVSQSNARLWGIVSDSSGAVVGGAEVVVHNQATGTEYSAKTNASGAYEMPALQVGTYKMQVRAAGM